MILFKKIRYKNFLAAGNHFIEIELNSNKNTIIVGENGSGKTTFIDAICFALYNRAFRDINKPLLINSLIGKGLLTEIEFSINADNYLVRRGIKPNIFEIFKNDQLLNQSAETKDYQFILEKQILKMNFKSFIQIVILGSANYVPFMKLTAHARREVIEDLLDIQVFSIMNSLLKEKINENKNNLISVDQEFNLCKQKLELNLKHLETLKTNNKDIINTYNDKILENSSKVELKKEELSKQSVVLKEKQTEKKKLNKLEKNRNEIKKLLSSINDKKTQAQKELDFYLKNVDCPTCKQQISKEFIHKAELDCQEKVKTYNDAYKELSKKLDGVILELDGFKNLENEISNLIKTTTNLEAEISFLEKAIKDLNKELKALKEKNKTIVEDSDIKANQTALTELEDKKLKILNDKTILDNAGILLKDGGIKVRVIQQYIPIMNKLINSFLSSVDFSVDFRIDENFNEKIFTRYKEEFCYDSFSEGQKVRINLAILFCWRAIARIRNSTSCSLLIMDEILDGSLDGNGTDDFLRILDSVTPNANVFIISHKIDMKDKFDHCIKFKEEKNFSVLEKI